MDGDASLREQLPFRLGPWRVDPDRCQVSNGECQRHVEPRAMAVLVYFASHPGTTVSREQLLDAVWKTRFVVEEALTRCISQLRQVLDDDARKPRILQTVPKVGYRLLVTPEPIGAALGESAAPALEVVQPEAVRTSAPSAEGPVSVRKRWAWLAGCVLVLAAAASITWSVLPIRESQVSVREHELSLLPAPKQSVAVLPFVSMSRDPEDAVFADGMTDEVIQLLSRVPRLRVPSRTSSFHFRDRNADLASIGRQLGVAHVLQGSLRRERNRLRIAVQLIDVGNDAHIWSEVYERELAAIFDVQRQIATAIAQKLADSLRPELSIGRPSATKDMVAYQLYLAAITRQHDRTEQAMRASIDLHKSAVARDPQFAEAWSALALAYWTLPAFADLKPAEIAEFDALAKSTAERALALDDSLGSAHMVLADYEHTQRRTSAAELHHRRALAAMPGDSRLHGGYAAMLGETGRVSESLSHREVAWRLEPLSGFAAYHLARGYLVAGRAEDARRFVNLSRELGFDGFSLDHAAAYLAIRTRDFATARALWERRADAEESRVMVLVIDALQNPELRPTALAAIQTLAPWHPLPFRGRFYAACLLGDREAAFQAAAEGVERGLDASDNWWIPEAQLLRTDARFADLVRRMNFIDYWREHGWPDACAAQGEAFECR
jgi:TolB-like protein/DNA-binding winged helix-turn-helix (wHTH) protein/Flp pilus assembly protein TadD